MRPVGPERAVLGKIGSKFYGIPLIMDILEENGLRATFFAEMFAGEIVDPAEFGAAYSLIRTRGHEPQLHLHPVFRFYHLVAQGLMDRAHLPRRMDLIGSLPLETQTEFLERGAAMFREVFGEDPVAFRAGCYGAADSTLAALERAGIRYDSSYNAAYLGISCLMSATNRANGAWRCGSVWEIPVTTFETGAGRLRGHKPLEVSAVSFSEMQGVLDQAERIGQDSVVVVLHSFAFLKRADHQFLSMRPDHLVIRRFRKFCGFLQLNRDRFKVSTFSEIPEPLETRAEIPLPRMGSVVPALRKCVQAVNRFYWI